MYNPRMNAGINPRMGQGFGQGQMQPGQGFMQQPDPFEQYGFPPMDAAMQPMPPMGRSMPQGPMGMPKMGGGFQSPVSQDPGFATPPMDDNRAVRSRSQLARPQTNRMPPRGREPVF